MATSTPQITSATEMTARFARGDKLVIAAKIEERARGWSETWYSFVRLARGNARLEIVPTTERGFTGPSLWTLRSGSQGLPY